MKERTWLNLLNLSDHYERKSRLLPAILTVLPLLPILVLFGVPFVDWLNAGAAGLGLGAALAVGFSHLASAAGNRFQNSLWPDWPHDAPTNRWLHPDDKSVSRQQKQRLYRALLSALGLDIQKAIDDGDSDELRALINDAVRALRNRLWQTPAGERVQLHNVDYGFARNLAGMRGAWSLFALCNLVGCWSAYFWYGGPIQLAVVSTVVAFCALVFFVLLPGYVRKKAYYYAESFFEAAMVLSTAPSGSVSSEAELAKRDM